MIGRRLRLSVVFGVVAIPASATHAAPAEPSTTAAGVAFEPNVGQAARQARFVGRGGGAIVFVESDGFTLARSTPFGPPEVTRLRFLGASSNAGLSGEQPLASASHYFLGADPARWRRDVPRFARVRARQLYPGIDLVLHADRGALEYDLEVAPFADPGLIRMAFDAEPRIDADGNLALLGEQLRVLQRPPVAFQEMEDGRRAMSAAYRLERGAVVFDLAGHDPSRPLVIDPTLAVSTYFGGSQNETARDVTVNGAGEIVVVGETLSLDLPVTGGAWDSACGGATSCASSGLTDCFVAKLNASGTGVIWVTYLGGSGTDRCNAVVADTGGGILVAGYSYSDYPTTAGAFQAAPGCGADGIVTKLDPTGSGLVYSTYVGGACGGDTPAWHSDLYYDVAVDAGGKAFLVGTSNSTSYPTTAGAFDPVCGVQPFCDGVSPHIDAVVTVLNAAGSSLVYSTFLGGSRDDWGMGIAVSAVGDAFITGMTESYSGPSPPAPPPGNAPLPTTVGAFQGAPTAPGRRGFVTRFNAGGSALVYSTMLGGHGTQPEKIDIGPGGYAYVVGSTMDLNFPTVPYRDLLTNFLMAPLGFVTKLAPAGSSLVYSTLIGNEQESTTGVLLHDVAIDSLGKAYVVGYTSADSYPMNVPLQPAPAGGRDAVVTVLQPNGAGQLSPVSSSFFYSTYLGGSGNDEALGVALANPGNAVVVGVTVSADFPEQSALEPDPLGGNDAFVVRITDSTTSLLFADSFESGDTTQWSATAP